MSRASSRGSMECNPQDAPVLKTAPHPASSRTAEAACLDPLPCTAGDQGTAATAQSAKTRPFRPSPGSRRGYWPGHFLIRRSTTKKNEKRWTWITRNLTFFPRRYSSFFSSFLWRSCLGPSAIPPRRGQGRLIGCHCLRRRDGVIHGFPKAATRSANAAEAM